MRKMSTQQNFLNGKFSISPVRSLRKEVKKKQKKIPYKDLREKYMDFIAYSENNRPAS